MSNENTRYKVLLTSYLELEHVDRLRAVDDRLEILYEPSLLRPPRHAADHTGDPNLWRGPHQEWRWRELLREADILFDIDPTHREDLPELAPRVRWIQATSAGIGQLVKQYHYDLRMPHTTFCTASGVHAVPLAEFVAMSMLMFTRDLWRLERYQKRKHWERYAGSDLHGRTLAIVGVGRVGSEVARVGKALGMTVIGTKVRPAPVPVDQLYKPAELHAMLPRAEFLVLSAPHTPETEKLIGAREFALLPKGAVFINIARGAEVDEPALVEALQTGHLKGAVLDVFALEPLPVHHPLWEMPNVLISPHSASTSDRENERITEIFIDNLRCFLAGEPLRNVLDLERLY